MALRETENNVYAKFWGDKQRALWYVLVFLECSIVIVAYQPFISSLNSENDFGAEIKSAIIREKNSLDKE